MYSCLTLVAQDRASPRSDVEMMPISFDSPKFWPSDGGTKLTWSATFIKAPVIVRIPPNTWPVPALSSGCVCVSTLLISIKRSQFLAPAECLDIILPSADAQDQVGAT